MIVTAPVTVAVGAVTSAILFRLLAAKLILPATFVGVAVGVVVIVQELLGLAHEVIVVGARWRR